MSKIVKINGVDVTDKVTPSGYKVRYESVQGNNSGRMLDGSYTEDEIAKKAVVTIPFMPLSENDISELLGNIYGEPYTSLYYYDPFKKAYITIASRRNVSEQKYVGTGTNGTEYWVGTVATFTER